MNLLQPPHQAPYKLPGVLGQTPVPEAAPVESLTAFTLSLTLGESRREIGLVKVYVP